jgi:pimeloyl-ACP methyl ester carboxylesterase
MRPQQTNLKRLPSFYKPISSATVPLLNGLARRALLRAGTEQRDAMLNGTHINYYYRRRTHTQPARHTETVPAVSNDLPIVLVHGLADSALTWSLVMGSLARDHDVYALDLPGYGFSGLPAGSHYARLEEMCDVLAAFVRQVVGRPALVVGNSMGAWLAVKLAWMIPEMTKGVVLIDSGGAPLEGRGSWEPFLEIIGVPDLRTVRMLSRQMFASIPPPLLDLGLYSMQELFQRQVVREFVAAIQEDEFLRADELRKLPAPAALIWGDGDHFLPRGSFEFFRDNLPGAPLLLIKRCGHLPQREHPLQVIRFIRTYAQRLTSPHDRPSAPRDAPRRRWFQRFRPNANNPHTVANV